MNITHGTPNWAVSSFSQGLIRVGLRKVLGLEGHSKVHVLTNSAINFFFPVCVLVFYLARV